MAEKLKIISLGGLNEIGKNMTVYEYGGDIIVAVSYTHLLAEPVPHHPGHGVFPPESDRHLPAGVHAEVLLAVLGDLKAGIALPTLAVQIGDHNLTHLVLSLIHI